MSPTIYLSKTRLLARLQRWRAADSILALRKQATDLRHGLDRSKVALRPGPNGDDVVALQRGCLADELDQIASAHTLERARYYLDRLIRSLTVARTDAINDLNLHRWKEYGDIQTDSLWIVDRRDSSGAHNADYWGNFIPQIPNQMMRRYTKRGDWVIDAFAGSGTTLIEGKRLGRHTLGVELNPEVADRARRLIALEPDRHGVRTEVVTGDSAAVDYLALLRRHGRDSVQLVIMHPPYFDIIPFSQDPRDLSNAGSVEVFLERMGSVVENIVAALEPGRYLVLVVGDKYAKGEWIPLGFLAMNEVLKRGLSLKSVVVKNFEDTAGKRNQKALWRYRALVGGFYVFKHEYIFVFRKPRLRPPPDRGAKRA